MSNRFRAVAFDLLTALIDSWSLWIDVAGNEALGRAWRRASLRRVTTAGTYSPYEAIVVEAADEVGVSHALARDLIERWAAGALRPWPEAPDVLARLAEAGWTTTVVSAERAGVYKTDPRAYRAGLAALGISDPSEALFVAGSPHDVPGARAVGMAVYWSNRFADAVPPGAPAPLRNRPDLLELPALLGARR